MELAFIVPVLLVVLAGIVELAFMMFTYLTMLDQTREAARFASVRNYRSASSGPASVAECNDTDLDYYKDTSCFFIDPNLNPYLSDFFTSTNNKYADMTISVFSVASGTTSIDIDRWPDLDGDGDMSNNQWSLYGNNWQMDCDGTTVITEPFITNDEMATKMASYPEAPRLKGIVLVEAHLCYHQVLNLPVFSDLIPTWIRLHAYTLMPAPEAIPTPTPIASP